MARNRRTPVWAMLLVTSAVVVVAVVAAVVAVSPKQNLLEQKPPPGPPGTLHIVTRGELASQPGSRAYFAGFSGADCYARGCSSPAACLRAYLSAVIERPTSAVMSALAGDAAEADRLCELHVPRLARAGPWRVAVFRAGRMAENGWPHTHGGVVCLPEGEGHFGRPRMERVETLVHERVHVYQRRFPAEAAELVSGAWGMRP